MAPGKLLGRLLIVAIVSLFDAIDDADADDGIQWLGDACNDDDDCHDAFNLLCVKGQCTCKHGFVSAQFSCHPASPLGGKCTYHAQCQYSDPHSACDLTGHCVCVEGFTMRQDTTKKCAAADADDDRQYPDVLRPHAITGTSNNHHLRGNIPGNTTTSPWVTSKTMRHKLFFHRGGTHPATQKPPGCRRSPFLITHRFLTPPRQSTQAHELLKHVQIGEQRQPNPAAPTLLYACIVNIKI
ncbi:uncharacterized protein LOC142571421 isoform X2 [Dermacentor variabilis]|uniref:uncharacterized protein LOC142571421 isoform X2 n=1 Tax=Dermacentor variabilis TaxID=34621 RepID=UPI003F5C87CB